MGAITSLAVFNISGKTPSGPDVLPEVKWASTE